tara:strand:+ start:2825 stop:3574 length:750 start_codon:yes stop_codon:yes gene_type:complete
MTETATSSENLRNMTEVEHLFLAQVLTTLPTPQKRHLKAVLNTAVFWVFSLAGFCILWFISSLLISTFTRFDLGISSDYAQVIFPVAILFAAIFSINSTRKWLATSDQSYPLVKADIATQKIMLERYQIDDVKCFKEPEHGGLLYFLLIKHPTTEQQKIRVVYDYESQNDNIDPQALLSISTQVTICSAPKSKLIVDNHFEGELLTNIKHFDLTVAPIHWPKPDSWETVQWQTLEQVYSVNSSCSKSKV